MAWESCLWQTHPHLTRCIPPATNQQSGFPAIRVRPPPPFLPPDKCFGPIGRCRFLNQEAKKLLVQAHLLVGLLRTGRLPAQIHVTGLPGEQLDARTTEKSR